LEFDFIGNVVDTETWELVLDSALEGYLQVIAVPFGTPLGMPLGEMWVEYGTVLEEALAPEKQSARMEFTPDSERYWLVFWWVGAGEGIDIGLVAWSDVVFYMYVEPGGDLAESQGESDSPFRFAGMYWDGHTSTYMTPHRQFSPRLGRWLSPDPHWNITTNAIFGDSPTMRNDRYMPSIHAILQSGNLFLFTMNNPVRWVDPGGTFVVCPYAAYQALKYAYQLAKPYTKYVWNGVKWVATKVGNDIAAAGRWIYGKAQQHTNWMDRQLGRVRGVFSRGGAPTMPSSVGLTGTDFEAWIVQKFGGTGSFTVGGRQFDAMIGNVWVEAKSSWYMISTNASSLQHFKSVSGQQLRLAQEHGAVFKIFSNVAIPIEIQTWLNNKGIPFVITN